MFNLHLSDKKSNEIICINKKQGLVNSYVGDMKVKWFMCFSIKLKARKHNQ
jgi:hypothetical protein